MGRAGTRKGRTGLREGTGQSRNSAGLKVGTGQDRSKVWQGKGKTGHDRTGGAPAE